MAFRVVGAAILVAALMGPNASAAAARRDKGAEIESANPPVLVGAGDIASSNTNDTATAAVVNAIAGTVFTAGDNAYSAGTAYQFRKYYAPTWGQFLDRTRPAPGNHDYLTDDAAGYFDYFGTRAGPDRRGYYSFDLGTWHIVSLNSNIDMAVGSTQEQWLRDDLLHNTRPCTLAIWHHPRFSSGQVGGRSATRPLWQALQDFNAEVVVTGHDHDYERFAPMTAGGTLSYRRGLREFVVGTGGASLTPFKTPRPNSEVRAAGVYGVIKFTLDTTSYTWEFVPVAGSSFTDSGSGTCH